MEVSNFICHLCVHRNTKCRVNELFILFRDALMKSRKLFLIDDDIVDRSNVINQKSDNFRMKSSEEVEKKHFFFIITSTSSTGCHFPSFIHEKVHTHTALHCCCALLGSSWPLQNGTQVLFFTSSLFPNNSSTRSKLKTIIFQDKEE